MISHRIELARMGRKGQLRKKVEKLRQFPKIQQMSSNMEVRINFFNYPYLIHFLNFFFIFVFFIVKALDPLNEMNHKESEEK